VAALKRWFGWGRFFVAASFFLAGWLILLWRKNPPRRLGLARIILVELGGFLLLGAVSAFANDSVPVVNSGASAGGIVGFGLAYPIRSLIGAMPAGFVLMVIAFVLLVLGFRMSGRIEAWAKGEAWTEATDQTTSSEMNSETAEFKPLDLNRDRPIPNRITKPKAQKPHEQMELPLPYQTGELLADKQPEVRQVSSFGSEALPSLSMLEDEVPVLNNQAVIHQNAAILEETLKEFDIPAKVLGYRVGPTVTQYAVEPGYYDNAKSAEKEKVRISAIKQLEKDLALAIKAQRLRIEAPVPGESYIGIDVPNANTAIVRLKPMLESPEFAEIRSPLAVPIGRGISGQAIVSDLESMPHLLIAGTTNSGKSVGIASLILSLAMNNHPDDLKFIMIDPKYVELRRFNGLPHLMGKVETTLDRILPVLRWATTEMDERYRKLEVLHARTLETYNQKMDKIGRPRLPKIVIVIDELSDLMISNNGKEVDYLIVRIAQKSRAVGIHLIVATQRPDTTIITGTIKANLPSRIAFTVASNQDSRVILDQPGAETLLGKGDLLFFHPQIGHTIRAQGVWVTDKEIQNVIEWWKNQVREESGSSPLIIESVKEITGDQKVNGSESPWEDEVRKQSTDTDDERLISQATELIRVKRRASASYLQRHLRLGYPKAAWLIEELEGRGVLGPPSSGKKEREILLPEPDEYESDERIDE
jgi:S-DNA-T family DNA segregation ATPase FtsK/SpoIIIE